MGPLLYQVKGTYYERSIREVKSTFFSFAETEEKRRVTCGMEARVKEVPLDFTTAVSESTYSRRRWRVRNVFSRGSQFFIRPEGL